MSIDIFARLARETAAAATPQQAFVAAETAVRALTGFRLFTILFVTRSGEEVERVHSSDPAAYTLTGRKRMGPTPWGAHVLEAQQPWFGADAAAMEWAFPDHALIASLGCGSCINIPVVSMRQLIGTLNVLDGPGVLREDQIPAIQAVAPAIALPLLRMAELEGASR
ncbi:GAF domain-containing protein [Humitalea rosea]|uniref:GAF domain-containing protein n=1 Tax=Humitalea rosea TaxID=990373 RepID=A0A2W7IY97_9PROT|nr:GAF domain-containing protein [Humitalea rosea]PZW43643.1 GAF domain-containing protein [Humitalea rosea]